MPIEDRNRYANLILLCNVHHKIVDDNENIWTIGALQQIKHEHEAWVEQSLGLDRIKLRDDAIYADYIDEWTRLAHLGVWTGWSSYILGGGQPRIRADVDNDLETLRRWLLSRIWPGRYPSLESAFHNFRRALVDFHETLHAHLNTRITDGVFFTEKFYHIENWDSELYERLSAKYAFHVDLVGDLMLELTRAANQTCDEIRQHIAHNFRLQEGNLIVQIGPDTNFQFVEFVPQYTHDEIRRKWPYPGLDQFYSDRANRDWRIGEGRPPE